MSFYNSVADDFYSYMHLNTEMQLPAGRETVLAFFERVQKTYPSMRNFYTRENGDFVLEEDKEQGQQRWLSLEPRRVCSGCLNPTTIDEAVEQHNLILDLIPYMLSVSPLDCEALDYMMGFDFSYSGNHDQLVAETLGGYSAAEGLMEMPGARVLNYEPNITIALDESCRRQARLMVETRTNAYQVRRGDFPDEQISVYFTARQYGSLPSDASFQETLADLRNDCEELLEAQIVENVLQPLATAIATR